MLILLQDWPALKSLLVSLISRCVSLRQKSLGVHAGRIGPVTSARIGFLCRRESLSQLVRQLASSLVEAMALESLELVWVNCTEPGFESIVTPRLSITLRGDGPLDCLVDFDACAQS